MSDYYQVICCGCNGCFPMHPNLNRKYRASGDSFYCPLCGQKQSYGDCDAERLKRMTKDRDYWIRRYEGMCGSYDHVCHQLWGLRGYLAKLKRGSA